MQGNELEREFFILRKLIEKERNIQFADKGDPAEFYICTLSNKLIVYKVGGVSALATAQCRCHGLACCKPWCPLLLLPCYLLMEAQQCRLSVSDTMGAVGQ